MAARIGLRGLAALGVVAAFGGRVAVAVVGEAAEVVGGGLGQIQAPDFSFMM